MTAAALVLAASAPAAAQEKKVINSASEMPALELALPKKPSELVIEGGAPFEAVKDQVEAYAAGLLGGGYEIRDRATEKQLRTVLMQVAISENRWKDALRLAEEIRALEDKAAAKAMVGVTSIPYARAALAVGEGSPRFAAAFKAEFEKSVAALDWAVVQDALQAMYGQYQLVSRDVMIGGIQGNHDKNAEAQGMKVGFGMGAGVVNTRNSYADILPHKDMILGVLAARVKAEASDKQDLWTQRLVELTPAQVRQPVAIAVWDSGFDPKVMGDRLWVNAKEVANGKDDDGNGYVDDLNGIAFDPDFKRTTGPLRPVPPEDAAAIVETLKLSKGYLDLQAAVASPEAQAVRTKIASLKPEEVTPFHLLLARTGLYLHGTATGYTSGEGNPGARLMHGRFDYRISAVPEPEDEAKAEAMARYVRDTVAYFKANGARVVNMSWRATEPQIAASLATVEPDPAKRKARAKAIFDTVSGALEESFRAAPEILFVAGAGNENEDVDFVRSFPAGINLPNLITVGAVDVALQPASFTSYGKSIDVYANGFEVPSKVPGGMAINISGTSLSAPQVSNLAGKIWAVNPKLSVAEVRAIIEETATAEGPRGLKVINPAAALARAAK